MADTTSIDRDLTKAHHALIPKVEAVLADVNGHLAGTGWELRVFEVTRTPARQLWLFNHGASKIKTARGPHCKRPPEAVDVVFWHEGRWCWPLLNDPKWTLVDKSAKAHNLRRISWDKPHLELKPADR